MNIVGKELIKLANKSDLIKDCLGIPKDFKNICYIGHNTVHQDLGNGKKRGLFYGKRKFKNYLTTNMLMNLEREGVFKSLEKKFGQEVVEEYMSENMLVGSKLKYGSGEFNPASGENSPVDGSAYRYDATNPTWTVLRAGAGTTSQDTTGTSEFFQTFCANGVTDRWIIIERSIFLFDTSSIGAGATVTATTMGLYGVSYSAGTNQDPEVNIYTSTPASNDEIINADYSELGTVAQSDTNIVVVSGWNTSGYNSWIFNSTGRGNVTVDGISKFGLREAKYDATGDEPTWSSNQGANCRGYYADNGSNEPKLDVTWDEAGWGGGSVNGVASASISSMDTVALANIGSINTV